MVINLNLNLGGRQREERAMDLFEVGLARNEYKWRECD